MVQRDSQAVDFRQQDRSGIRTVDFGTGRVRGEAPVRVGDDQYKARLITGLLQDVGRVAGEYAQIQKENAYLEGAAKAGRIESEEELEGNIITRDWAVAGYRDTMGKLAMADAEARLMRDMKTLREQSPEAMQRYLEQRRREITPTFEGMSREQRTAAFGKLLLNERAALAKHTTEHQAFIWDTESTALRSEFQTKLHSLTDARVRMDPRSYSMAIEATAGTVIGSIWENPRLPRDIRQKLTAEALTQALHSDNVGLYEYLSRTAIPDGAGGSSTLLSRLDSEDAVRLSGQYREARNRTAAMRGANYITQHNLLDAQMKQDQFPLTWNEYKQHLDQGLSEGFLNGAEYGGAQQRYFEYAMKRNDQPNLEAAARSGDTQYLTHAGKSEGAAFDALDARYGKERVPTDLQVADLFSIGIRTGSAEAMKRAGQRIGPAVMQLQRPDGTLDEQHRKVLTETVAALDSARAAGLSNTEAAILSGMEGPAQTRFLRVMEHMRRHGKDEATAVKDVLAVEAREAAMTASAKAGAAQAFAQSDNQAVEALDSIGMVRAFGLHISALWNKTDEARIVISPRDTIGTNDAVVQEYTNRMKEEVRAELSGIRTASPYLDSKSAVAQATAEVAKRTVRTKHGPLILPRGANPQQMFGVASNIGQDLIGRALDEVFQPKTKGGQIVFTSAQGGIRFAEYDENGIQTNYSGPVNPRSIGDKVAELVHGERVLAMETYGNGRRVRQGNAEVRFNGVNDADVDERLMLRFRNTLVQNEGVRSSEYKDTRGIRTIGVGISERSEFFPKPSPDGTVSQQQLDEAFMKASNAAMRAGSAAMGATGLRNDDWLLLFAELGYQSGASFLTSEKSGPGYQRFVAAAQTGDLRAARAAFKDTAAYKFSGAKRRTHYLSMVEKAMR